MKNLKKFTIRFLKYQKFNFSFFKKSSSKRVIYTQPLNDGEYNSLPVRFVPPEIIRPGFAQNPPIMPEQREKSILKTEEEKANFKEACKIAGEAVRLALESVKIGITTEDIDKVVHDYIVSKNAYPTPINYMGFPKSVCTSVNEVACHGIPNLRPLQNGDYLNIDVCCYYKGFHGDSSGMATVGDVHQDIKKLIEFTRKSLFKAISICKPGEKVKNIGSLISEYAKKNGFTVCTEFCGHGVGKDLHMLPYINHIENDVPDIMVPGMAFTIEPIIMMYPYDELYMWEDNWTVIAENNPSAQWEHTILITESGYEILTFRKGETFPEI